MSSTTIAVFLAAASARWWWPFWATLLDELRSAADPSEPPSEWTERAPTARDEARVRPNRALAFNGVSRRTAARRRWQGGFGRRGL